MLKVGITGGIGSGKTTVCKIFESLGIPVYYADDRAKWLMRNDPDLRAGIEHLFGPEAYDEQGNLNRQHIAAVAFDDPEKLSALNSLVHPAVFLDADRWNAEQEAAGAPYTIKEAALIFESGSYRFLDKVITVYAPKEVRLRRVMDRDGAKRADIEARMDKQLPEEEKMSRSDFVIFNDGSRPLIKQVLAIHQQLTHAQV